MITLDNQELTHAQLTLLAQQDLTGYDRAVQALEDAKINGMDPSICFLGTYANPESCTNSEERAEACNTMKVGIYGGFIPDGHILTAVECAVIDCRPGQPLTTSEQAFLALCKQVRTEVCSHQATGSEK